MEAPTDKDRQERAREHEERSQKSADALRAMLTALATAGMGAAYTVRDPLRGNLWWWAAASFALSLACVLGSWFLVKHRALFRRDVALGIKKAKLADKSGPKFHWLMRSFTWDCAGALLIVAGVILLGIYI